MKSRARFASVLRVGAGTAASIELNRAARHSNCMEDLLQERRERNAELTPDMVDGLLRCGDALRRYVDGLKIGAPDSSRFSEVHQALLALQLEAPAKPNSAPPPPVVTRGQHMTDDAKRELRKAGVSSVLGVIGQVRFQADFPLIGLKARLVHERLSLFGDVFFLRARGRIVGRPGPA